MKKRKRIKSVLATPLGIKKLPFPKDLINISRPFNAADSNKNEEQASLTLSSRDIRTLADLGTNLWRAKQRLLGSLDKGSQATESKKILRPIESALENIENIGIRIMDFTGQPYVQGMALNIVSSQPNSSLKADRICETLKPTIYFREQFIQAGDVIIEGPPSSSALS
jgi:hypothetical protein